MSKYINIDNVYIPNCNFSFNVSFKNGWNSCKDTLDRLISKHSTSDLREIKQGRIIEDYCSCCGRLIPTDNRLDFIPEEEINFCYYCGAELTK